MRDDFSKQTIETLADRAGNRCSNPGCRQPTSGPRTEPDRAVNIGVAAHITAASEGGPRYDPALTPEERRHADNGLWLCQNCAKLVDNDATAYPVDLLRAWKLVAEDAAKRDIERPRAEGTEPRASASDHSVVARDIHAPVSTGEGSIAATGDVVFADRGSQVQIGDRQTQIGGSIQAGSIQAQNVVSGTQTVGPPDQAAMDELRRQIAELQEQLAKTTIDEVGKPGVREIQAALVRAVAELARTQSRR
jgi:hypothetical protein